MEVKRIDSESKYLPDQALIDQFKNSNEYKTLCETYPESLYIQQQAHGDDLFVRKFLIECDGNVSKALDLYKKMIQWRHEQKVDDSLSWRFPQVHAVKAAYPHKYCGFDKEGRPVYVERVGVMDIESVMKDMSVDDLTRYHILHWEFVHRVLFPRGAMESGKNVDQLVTIADLSGLHAGLMNKSSIEFLKRIAQIDQEYYPDSACKLYIVNVPWLFKAVWKILRPLLGARGRAKIEILHGDCSQTLLEEIGANGVPDFLGGNCKWEQPHEDTIWCDLVSGKYDVEMTVDSDNFAKTMVGKLAAKSQ